MELKEYVAFDKLASVEAGLVRKHGQEAFGPGTFGFEIEFVPKGGGVSDSDFADHILGNVDPDYLLSAVHRRDLSFENAFSDWVVDQRKRINRGRYNWDDSYGPPDEDEWTDMNPEPDESGDEYYEWKSRKDDAMSEYSNWERRDKESHKREFVESIGSEIWDYITPDDVMDVIRRYNVREYNALDEYKNGSPQEDIESAEYFLTARLNQAVGPSPTKTTWNVGMDGENIEIRSRHMKRNETNYVTDIFEWLRDNGYATHGGTSAHVHIGLPANFNAFDMLAMTTLVDERAIKIDVGPNRELSQWAALRDKFGQAISKKIDEMLKEKNHTIFKFKESTLENALKATATKFSGTNISSVFEHGTVEFRYFGSDIKNPDTLIAWINYFMLLPKVAKSRNKVAIGNIVFQRGDSGGDVIVARIGSSKNYNIASEDPERYLDKLRNKRRIATSGQ